MKSANQAMSLSLPAGRSLALDRPRIMGVLNVTPDSFSDGGRFADAARAAAAGLEMVSAGADIIDVGGESTRPGARPVGEAEETDRVLPVVQALVAENVLVSVDTSKPGLMRAAAQAGAAMINDVRALSSEDARKAVVDTGLAACLMHMQGEPRTMQRAPVYTDVVQDVLGFLLARAAECEAAGIDSGRIVIDPGFGFGKTLEHNLALLGNLDRFCGHGYPVLVGLSRKSMLGTLTGRSVDQRLAGSLATAALAAWQGAHIIRVHDVAESCDVVAVVAAALEARQRERGHGEQVFRD